MANSNYICIVVTSSAFEHSTDPHRGIYELVRSVYPTIEFVSKIAAAQEPYESVKHMIKARIPVLNGENAATQKAEFTQAVCSIKKGKKFSLTFERPEEISNFYSVLFISELDDFNLGSLSLANLEFYQKFKHGAQFKSAAKPLLTLAFDLEKVSVSFAISNIPVINTTPADEGNSKNEITETTEVYQLRVKFSNIEKNNILVKENPKTTDIYFPLKSPLEFWRSKENLQRVTAVNDSTRWVKTVHLKSTKRDLRAVNLSQLLGDTTVLCLSVRRLSENPSVNNQYHMLLRSLEMSGFTLNFASILRQRTTTLSFRAKVDIFSIDWYLDAIFALGYHTKMQITDDFKRYVFTHKQNPHMLQALESTYIKVSENQHAPLLKTLQYFIENSRILDDPVPNHNCYIRRVVITPTRQIYLPQSLMHENRILREFDREYAISVSFRNDDFTQLNDQFSSKEFIYDTIFEALKKGLRISNRHYQILGCSGSQERNHACWLYATDNFKNTSESIRSWIGDLRHVTIPGKYVSRVGQCFSKTKPVNLSQYTIVDSAPDVQSVGNEGGESVGSKDVLVLKMNEDDVQGGERDYCFSDGVGTISPQMLQDVFVNLDENLDGDKLPSAFQIRLGGAKGMLSLDTRLNGRQILVRRSMNKFPSKHRKLEIMRIAQPMCLQLNRQIITLLCYHRGPLTDRLAKEVNVRKHVSGVRGGNHEFTVLFMRMMFNLADSFIYEQKAMESLGSRTTFNCQYAALHNAGYSLVTDPFFREMAQVVASERVEKIKTKFNVEIPQDQARNMFGIMDETGKLKYGQVFVQYSYSVQRPRCDVRVHQGDVLVSKMPCLHPGDVRVFKATYIKELDHIIDCIVFPQKGPRPHPDEMAGSDLDGDEYFVCWREGLLLRNNNADAMDYGSGNEGQGQGHNHRKPVETPDIIEHMVKFIYSDSIGQVASAHVAQADLHGIYHEKCLKLCHLHSQVIDSPKSGKELPQNCLQEHNLRPFKYPDFMNKMDHKDTYRSNSVLGRMYRISRRVQIVLSEKIAAEITLDTRFLMPEYEAYLESARELKLAYNDAISRLSQEYGVSGEVELVSGCILRMTSNLSISEDDNYNTRKLLQGKYEAIVEQIRIMFYEDLNVEKDHVTQSAMRKAAACYYVTYGETTSKNYFSFAWIFSDLLSSILQKPDHEINPRLINLTNSLQSMTDDDVDQFLKPWASLIGPMITRGRIYYVLLHWWKWNEIFKIVASKKIFIDRITQSLQMIQTTDLTLGEILLGTFENLSTMSRENEKEEELSREILLATFRLSMYADWRALKPSTTEVRRMNQTIFLAKWRWLKIQNDEGAFYQTLQNRFPQCIFKIRPYGHNGLLHVMGPAMAVYDFVDLFYPTFENMVKS